MAEKMKYAVPIGATFNRITGEITFQIADDLDSCRKFGEIMRRIGRDYQHYQDREAQEAYEKRTEEQGNEMEVEAYAG